MGKFVDFVRLLIQNQLMYAAFEAFCMIFHTKLDKTRFKRRILYDFSYKSVHLTSYVKFVYDFSYKTDKQQNKW